MVDYSPAQSMLVDESRVFIDALAGLAGSQLSIVIHKTGGTPNLASLASYFQTGAGMASTHFGIDLDGQIGQFVLLKDGAGGNCCVEQGYDQYWTPFLSTYGNLNRCTISIEHIDPSLTNSTTPPAAQITASFALVKWLVQKFNIPLDHIKTHASIDPIDRANCPGNYPMAELLQFLQNGGSMVPTGWLDDGTTLTAPNGVHVVLGFRQFVLNTSWPADNWPLYAERTVQLLEASNPALGGGQQQVFRYAMLGWSASQNKVIFEWLGQELAFVRDQLNTVYPAYQQLKTDNAQLTAQVAALEAQLVQAQTGLVSAAAVKDRLSAIALQSANDNAAIQQLVTQPL